MARDRYRGVSPWVLVGVTMGLFAIRLIVSLLRTGPVLVADEIGYLMNARVLAGGLPGQLQLAPFYHGGYSLLLAPILDLSSNPGIAYRLVLALNAALAASVFPLLYVLLTRCAGVAPRTAIGPAVAGAAYPTITVLSQAAMSENALFPLTCVWLIAVCELVGAGDSHRSVLRAAATAASAAALWAVHGRMITAVILTAAIVGWLGIRRRLRPVPCVTALAVLAAGLWAVHVLDSFLIERNYGGHVANETDVRLSALLHPNALLTAGENLIGQGWYLLVATFGLAALVSASALRSTGVGEAVSDAARGARVMVRMLVALTALLLIVSAAAFPVRSRPDMLIYGRYVGVVAPPLVAVGLVLLSRLRAYPGIRAGLLGAAVLTAIVVLFSATSGHLGSANRLERREPAVRYSSAGAGDPARRCSCGSGRCIPAAPCVHPPRRHHLDGRTQPLPAHHRVRRLESLAAIGAVRLPIGLEQPRPGRGRVPHQVGRLRHRSLRWRPLHDPVVPASHGRAAVPCDPQAAAVAISSE